MTTIGKTPSQTPSVVYHLWVALKISCALPPSMVRSFKNGGVEVNSLNFLIHALQLDEIIIY